MKSILIGRKHGSETWEAISNIDVPHQNKVDFWRSAVSTYPVNETFAELQLHRCDDSTELFARKKFVTAAQAKANVKSVTEADAMHERSNDDGAKRQLEANKAKVEEEAMRRAKEVERINKIHDAHRELFCGKPKEEQKAAIDALALEEIKKKADAEKAVTEADRARQKRNR